MATDPILADSTYDDAGNSWNVDPAWLRAISGQESGGTANPDQAVSSAKAVGTMQIMPGTATEMGVTDRTNHQQSIFGGARYFSQMLDRYQNQPNQVPLAIAAYNAGPGRVDQVLQGQATLPAETAAYVPSVIQRFNQYKQAVQPAGGAQPVATPQPQDQDDGESILNAYMQPASAAKPQQASTAAAPGEDILDAYTKAASAASKPASNDNPPPAVPSQPSMTGSPSLDAVIRGVASVPAVQAAAAGVKHGFQSVPDVINRASAYVDSKVPFLAGLDSAASQSGLISDPAADVAKQPAAEAAYQAQVAGHPLAAGIGNFIGQGAAAAPILGGALAPVGAIGGALAEGAGGALTGVGRGIQAATDLATGTVTPGAGIVPNALAISTGGAVQGAGFNALTGGDIKQGAEAGALMAPALIGSGNALAGIGRAASSAGTAIVNKLNPARLNQSVNEGIDAIVAEAKARAATPTEPPAATPTAPTVTPAAPVPVTAPIGTPVPQPTATAAPVTPVTASPLPPTVAAATSGAAAPAEAAAARATAFNTRMSTGANSAYDATEYVPGSKPTEAEAAASPELAAQQRVLAAGNSDAALLDRENNAARLDHFDNLAGTPATVQVLQAQRAAQAQTDLAAAWQSKQPVDAQPVADTIQSILAGPDGKRTAVKSTLGQVLDTLHTPDGTGLESDPEMLYGVRQNITDLMSKQGQQDSPLAARALGSLQQVKDALDGVIESGASGYKQYLSNYATASQPIDAQEVLQSFRPNLMDNKGNIQLSRVNTMMKSIGQRMQTNGIDPAKSISDDQLNGLFNLRQDLLRQSNRDLARPAGSNTAKDLSVMDSIGQNALAMGAHVAAAHIPGANLLVNPAIASLQNSGSAAAQKALANRLFSPVQTTPLNRVP